MSERVIIMTEKSKRSWWKRGKELDTMGGMTAMFLNNINNSMSIYMLQIANV
jgi:hypothetical protein